MSSARRTSVLPAVTWTEMICYAKLRVCELASNQHLERGDKCWSSTHRHRLLMRATVLSWLMKATLFHKNYQISAADFHSVARYVLSSLRCYILSQKLAAQTCRRRVFEFAPLKSAAGTLNPRFFGTRRYRQQPWKLVHRCSAHTHKRREHCSAPLFDFVFSPAQLYSWKREQNCINGKIYFRKWFNLNCKQ